MFHNGKELTADDVKTCLEVQSKIISVSSTVMGTYSANFPIKMVEKLSKYSVKVYLKSATPFIQDLATWMTSMIWPAEEVVQNTTFNNPTGTGPYKIKEFISGVSVTLERVPHYWGENMTGYWVGPAYMQTIIFKYIPEETTRMAELETGASDITTIAQISNINILKDEGFQTIVKTGGSYQNLAFNCRNWPMNDTRFRRALYMAVDWEKIVPLVCPGYERLTDVLELTPYSNPAAAAFLPTYDLEAAKSLVEQVAADAGKTLPITITLYDAITPGSMAEYLPDVLISLWAKIGVQLNVRMIDPGSVRAVRSGNIKPPGEYWDIFCLYGEFRLVFNPRFCWIPFNNASGLAKDGMNYMGYNNAEMNNLTAQSLQTVDTAALKTIYQKIQRIWYEELPMIPVFSGRAQWAINPKVHGFNEAWDRSTCSLTNVWKET